MPAPQQRRTMIRQDLSSTSWLSAGLNLHDKRLVPRIGVGLGHYRPKGLLRTVKGLESFPL